MKTPWPPLASNRTETIFISESGIIWVGTFSNGLDRFDPVTNTFTHFTHDPSDPASLGDNTVTAILEDRQGALWVGTGSPWESKPGEGGLNRFHPESGTFTRYLHDPKDPNTLLDNKVRAIFEDSRGTFWVGTQGDGLHTMDREKGTFTRHRHDPRHPEKLSRSPLNGSNAERVTFVHEDAAGDIWIGAYMGGVSRYDPKTGKVEHLVSGTSNSGGLLDNALRLAHSSKEGVLWFSSLGGGYLYRIDPFRVSFTNHLTGTMVFLFFEDASGKVWAGTDKGLKMYGLRKQENQQVDFVPSLPPGLTKGRAIPILEDQQGIMWVGGEQGLWRRDPKTHAFTLYSHDPQVPNSLGQGAVIAIYESRDGYLWIGTENGGLSRMDRQTGAFIRFQHDPANPHSLSQNFVSAIYEDRQGNLWVGTWNGGGLNRLDRNSGNVKRFLEKNDHSVSAIREDAIGNLWIGSDHTGLFLYNRQKDGFVQFRDKNTGQPFSAGVRGMVADEQGNLWASTTGGLLKVDREGTIAARYGAEMGLDPESFRELAAYLGKTGRLYIGHVTGFYSYLPVASKVNANPPHIELTEFRLFDVPVTPGAEGPLGTPLSQAKEVVLTHDQNVFSFDFTGIHFTNPSQNRLLFMLENYDGDWRRVKSDHTASYFKVPPGKYVFRVKAASSEGIWAEKAIAVIIHPPWWQTWWAYGSYALLLAGGIFTFDRFQRRRIINRERERTRERELAQAREVEKAYEELKRTQTQLVQAKKMASLGELTAGIAHEIQNPLNFVNNFSEVSEELVEELEQEATADHKEEVLAIAADLRQNLSKIHHHGQRADAIVKNMLQHSRPTSGEKQLTNLNALADEYLRLAYHGLRAKDKSFNCTLDTDYDPNLEQIEVVPQDIGRVLLNLYNNAFYAVQQKAKLVPAWHNGEGEKVYAPTITVSTHQREGQVEIRVQDNGTGMPESLKSKIFQPFFTTKPTGQGTGLGLSLSYDIVTKAHGGELTVKSEEGEETEFTLRLPSAIRHQVMV